MNQYPVVCIYEDSIYGNQLFHDEYILFNNTINATITLTGEALKYKTALDALMYNQSLNTENMITYKFESLTSDQLDDVLVAVDSICDDNTIILDVRNINMIAIWTKPTGMIAAVR